MSAVQLTACRDRVSVMNATTKAIQDHVQFYILHANAWRSKRHPILLGGHLVNAPV